MKIVGRALRKIFAMALVVTIFGGNSLLAADQKTVRRYPISGQGTLELTVPATWQDKVHSQQEKMPPTLIFKPASGSDFEITLIVSWGKKGDKGFNSPDTIRAALQAESKKLLQKIKEPAIALQELKGTNTTGYFFSVTDNAPEPGEYRYMTRASIGVGTLLLNATILHRVKESETVKDALSMLREAKQAVK
jgi:hypothetical protein